MKTTHFRNFLAIFAIVFAFAACSDDSEKITAVHSISLSHTEHVFDTAIVGYDEQDSVTVTVTNTGNQATSTLDIALSGANASSFSLSTTSLDSIYAGGSDSFTVSPNTGLSAGTYTATVTVSGGNGIEAKSYKSFTVTEDDAFKITFETIAEGAPVIGGPITISQTALLGSHTVVVDMYDSYGDGWDGNGALRINVNGIEVANNIKVHTIAANNNPSGQRSTNTYTFNIGQSDTVEFYWVAGSSQDENSFIVYYADYPPSPAFTASNNHNWNGSNALLYRLRDASAPNGLNGVANNTLLGSFALRSQTATLTVTNPDDYTSIEWYYGSTLLNTTPVKQATLTLSASDIRYNEVGTHHLTLWVEKDGRVYSRNIQFTVY